MLIQLRTPFKRPTAKQIAEARKVARARGVNSILSIGSDPKTAKSNDSGITDSAGKPFFTAIHYGAPARLSGYEACAGRSAGCTAACLHTAGNPVYFKNKNKARIARTKLFFEDRNTFEIVLYAEITAFVDKCEKFGLHPAIRLNGTTDIIWERVCGWIFEEFPQVQFYDYTKIVKRCLSSWVKPVNYDLTLSRSETNEDDCLRVLRDNPNSRVAVVFAVGRTKPLPTHWEGFEVGNADAHDMRFIDTTRISGLHAKGDARADSTGFSVSCGN